MKCSSSALAFVAFFTIGSYLKGFEITVQKVTLVGSFAVMAGMIVGICQIYSRSPWSWLRTFLVVSVVVLVLIAVALIVKSAAVP